MASAMEDTDWMFANGNPVSWLQSRISGKNAKEFRGYEIMFAVCKRAAVTGDWVGFVGSTATVISGLVSNLCGRLEG